MTRQFELPKYAQIVTAIQQRISDGTYTAGAAIPTETQLGSEFSASRGVVVRALEMLAQDGWIEARQGSGRFVQARGPRPDPAILAALQEGRATDVTILGVDRGPGPTWVHDALGLPGDAVLLARRRLVNTGIGPIELGTVYVPADLAAATDLGHARPLRADDILDHITQRTGVTFSHANRRISARPGTGEETRQLQLSARATVLTVDLVVHDRPGRARLVVHTVLAPTRVELDDVISLA
jgi:GntR family transcriptional regulator